jgi:pimeloyl-ACP methyl ester carboxylesterase
MESCLISKAAEVLAELVSLANDSGQWGNVYLVGHDWGGTVAWQVAQILPKDAIAALVVINAPHPLIQFGAFRKIPTRDLPFKSFLSPLSDAYLPLKSFEPFAEMVFEDEAWFNTEWKHEYMRQWKQTGASNLRCYFKDNIESSARGTMPAEPDVLKEINPDTHILMMRGDHSPFNPNEAYEKTIG